MSLVANERTVAVSGEDLLAGRDAVLEAALDWIAKGS